LLYGQRFEKQDKHVLLNILDKLQWLDNKYDDLLNVIQGLEIGKEDTKGEHVLEAATTIEDNFEPWPEATQSTMLPLI
jgi:hypothetical protein